jgi:hypothetical protein
MAATMDAEGVFFCANKEGATVFQPLYVVDVFDGLGEKVRMCSEAAPCPAWCMGTAAAGLPVLAPVCF